MTGPSIIVASISANRMVDQFGNSWQYHPRSDHHSKVSCWALLFDLLRTSSVMQRHAAEGRIGYGVNHGFQDPVVRRSKKLDLVVCTRGTGGVLRRSGGKSFKQRVDEFGIELAAADRKDLDSLPDISETSVGSVLIAIEAKACMTEHVKSIPRAYDEIASSIRAVNNSSHHSIAGGLVMVNAAPKYLSPTNNMHCIGNVSCRVHSGAARYNHHKQPHAAQEFISRAVEQHKIRSGTSTDGFDALALLVVDMRNDKGPIDLVGPPLGPVANTTFDYDYAVRRMALEYDGRFATIS